MSIDKDTARRVAHLARIEVAETDLDKLAGELSNILGFMEQLNEVVESLVIGQDWDNDTRVVLFVRLREGLELSPDLERTIKTRIRTGASPRHVPAKIVQVTDIPRTRSGKIVELAVRDVVHGRPIKNKEALDNPQALEQFRDRPELAE